VKARVFRNRKIQDLGFSGTQVGLNGFSGTRHGFSGTNFGLSGTTLGFSGTKKRVIRNAKYRVFKNQPFGFSGTYHRQNP
jgi:hypothetical protein